MAGLDKRVIPAFLLALGCCACQKPHEAPRPPPAAAQSTKPQPPNPMATHADRLAHRFGLELLSVDSEPELRLWETEYVFGNIQAAIIRKDRITTYFLPNEGDPSEPLIGSQPTNAPPPVFGMMSDLAKLDGVAWGCPVMDGASVLVDGVSNGRRFSFEASNFWMCDDPRRAVIEKAYELIGPRLKPTGKPGR